MNTTFWPYCIPTQETIRKSPKAIPASLVQDDYIAFPSGATPARIVQVQSNYPAGSDNGVVECLTVWSENPGLVGKARSYQWRSIVASQARFYKPERTAGQVPNSAPSSVPPPGMLAALSCIDQSIQTGFKQAYSNQSEIADKLDETIRLLGELLAAFKFAWHSGEGDTE